MLYTQIMGLGFLQDCSGIERLAYWISTNDSTMFTYRHQGLDFKLRGVEHARIVSKILS